MGAAPHAGSGSAGGAFDGLGGRETGSARRRAPATRGPYPHIAEVSEGCGGNVRFLQAIGRLPAPTGRTVHEGRRCDAGLIDALLRTVAAQGPVAPVDAEP